MGRFKDGLEEFINVGFTVILAIPYLPIWIFCKSLIYLSDFVTYCVITTLDSKES